MKNATQFAIIGTSVLLFIQLYSYLITNLSDLIHINRDFVIISLKFLFIFQLVAYVTIINFFICYKKNISEKDETNEIGKNIND
jgi:cell shape-determining protein MreD